MFRISLLAVLFLLVVAESTSAHTVGVSRGDYHVNGNQVTAELIFARPELANAVPGLDVDQDGTVSFPEVNSAREVIDATIVRGVEVRTASHRCESQLQTVGLTEEDGVAITVQYHCDDAPQTFSLSPQLFGILSYGHRHLATVSAAGAPVHVVVYAANPSFALATSPAVQAERPTLRGVAWPLFSLGVEHILTGYDHLLFLLGLILVGGTVRSLLLVISAFTLAHSITLGLATLNVWVPSPMLIEPAIALSVAYVGVENWFITDASRRWLITFPFGLVHGFGFAGALREISLPAGQIPIALAAFNLGVEAGQLAVLAVVLPIVLWLRQQRWFAERGVKGLSAGIALAGICWFIRRVG